jgi:hypothetical protein
MEDRFKSVIPDKLVTFFKDAIDQIIFDGIGSVSDKQKELLLKYKLIGKNGKFTELAKGEFADVFESISPISNIERVLLKLNDDVDFDRHAKFSENKILELKSRRAKLKNKIDELKGIDPKSLSIKVYIDELEELDARISHMQTNQSRINDIHVQKHGHEDIYTQKEKEEKDRKKNLVRFSK